VGIITSILSFLKLKFKKDDLENVERLQEWLVVNVKEFCYRNLANIISSCFIGFIIIIFLYLRSNFFLIVIDLPYNSIVAFISLLCILSFVTGILVGQKNY
jgi:hypothetical protein